MLIAIFVTNIFYSLSNLGRCAVESHIKGSKYLKIESVKKKPQIFSEIFPDSNIAKNMQLG